MCIIWCCKADLNEKRRKTRISSDLQSVPLHSDCSLDQDQGSLVDCMEVGQTSQKSPEADGILQSLCRLSGSKMIIDEIEVFRDEFC